MKVRVESRDLSRLRAELLAVPVPKIDDPSKRLPVRLQQVDRLLGGQLASVVASGDFRGGAGETLLLFPEEGSDTKRVLLVGVGLRRDALRS